MTTVRPERVAALLEEVAGDVILPRFRNLQSGDITDKGGGDFVTLADQESEALLTRALADLLPGSVVVGEEAVHGDASILARLSGDAPVWIIDPLDGTNNFTRGSDLFAVMAALVVKGQTVLGAIHLPVRRETATAELGSGAFMAGRKLRTAPPRPLGELRASVHTRYLPQPLRARATAATQQFRSNEEVFCCGQVYVALADGRFDGALYWRTHPWDHAMGELILAEAGGVTAYSDESPYTPLEQGRKGLIAASDLTTWRALRDALFPDDR